MLSCRLIMSSIEGINNPWYLVIGYNACPVYEAIDIIRCYKRCGFKYVFINCRNVLLCPKCAGPRQVKDCTAVNLRRVNYMNHKDKNGIKVVL